MITAGRINKLFGTGGGLRLTLYASFPEDFDPATTPLIVEIDGLEVPLWCERFEYVGASGAEAAFADLDTERRAAELVGREFRIESGAEERPDDDEFYLEDLIGFTADLRETGRRKRIEGVVSDYFDSETNPLFEVRIGERSVLVPAVDAMIGGIDFEARRIRFILPEGLLDLE